MKALSIRQPFIEMILSGQKEFEFRDWQTDYRGPMLLHASNALIIETYQDYETEFELPPIQDCQRGGIVGRCNLESIAPCVPGAYKFEWKLTDIIRFPEIIPYRGKLMLFDVPPETVPKNYYPRKD